MSLISVDLANRRWKSIGSRSAVTDALESALAENGALLAEASGACELLIVSTPLLPDGVPDPALLEQARAEAAKMPASGGRVVFILSALAALPMKPYLAHSAGMAAFLAGMRVLAMDLAPSILVNAVGVGLIEQDGERLAGDPRMLTHVSVGAAGTAADVVNAVLFLLDPANTYTTGQILNVDGGWTVGYGRNF